MKIRFLAVLMMSLCAFAQPAQKFASADAQAITSRAFVGGHSMQYLTEMTDRFGPRLLSSDNYMNAAKWAADQFRAMGIKDVKLETFTIPHSWKRGEASGRILTPDHGPFMLAGIPAFDMLVDMKAYMEIHHNAGDTLDKVNERNLNIGAAVLAITADYIANADQPIGVHLDREAMGKILKEKDLGQFLHSIGDW